MTFQVTYPPDADIVISVRESRAPPGRFLVVATYKFDKHRYIATGSSYAKKGIFYDLLGIGESLDAALKKATCRAINELKNAWYEQESSMISEGEAEKICSGFVKECGEGR